MKCPNCKESQLHTGSAEISETIDGVLYFSHLPADTCGGCQEVFFHGPALEAFERAVAAHIARHGPMGSEGLIFMRLQLDLFSKALAELLNVTPMHFSRWENGRRPLDRNAWLLVGELMLDALDQRVPLLERMEALSAPTQSPVRLHIEPRAA